MDPYTLQQTISTLCTDYKGILAADESPPTLEKRFNIIDLENTLEHRLAYRKLLFTTPHLSSYISGVLLHEETLIESELTTPLIKSNILLGIKADTGLTEFNNEKIPLGIDTLHIRLKHYYNLGAKFSKFRSVFTPNSSYHITQHNTDLLARYAQISIQNNIVPIVEPELLLDNNINIDDCEHLTRRILIELIYSLHKYNVPLDLTLIKPNMVRPGDDNNIIVTNREIARRTLKVLTETIPPCVPGIFFLSGGMNEINATDCLRLINDHDTHMPWRLSFSFGRALQESVLKTWQGNPFNNKQAQQILFIRTRENGLASMKRKN